MDAACNMLVILMCFVAVYLLPNTEQIMTRFKPALEWGKWSKIDPAAFGVTFRFSAAWIAYIALLFFLGLIFIARGTPKFIYFNF